MCMKNKTAFFEGFRDGIPIGLGYFAVSFSLGILARNAGLNAIQGFFASFFCLASAGEYALFTSIQSAVTFLEIAIITLVVNARYLLMSCSLSQKFSSNTGLVHRLLVGFGVTDEIFGISFGRPGLLNPFYNYGAIAVAASLWSFGTSLGIIAGNFLPVRFVSALSVALYGMFLAIIIPPARKNLTIALAIIVSFVASYISSMLPLVRELSGGTRTIILTVIIAAVCALVKPLPVDAEESCQEDSDE